MLNFYYRFLLLITSKKQAAVPSTFLYLKIMSGKLLFTPVLFLRIRQLDPWIVFTGCTRHPGSYFFHSAPYCRLKFISMQEHLWVWSTLQGSVSHSCKVAKTSAARGGPASFWAHISGSEWPEFVFFTFETLFLFSWCRKCTYVMEYMITWGLGPDPRISSPSEDKPCMSHLLLQTTWCWWPWTTVWQQWYHYDRKHWEKRAWICCLKLRKSTWDRVSLRYCPWLQICLCFLNWIVVEWKTKAVL